jgi:hypothetical protein
MTENFVPYRATRSVRKDHERELGRAWGEFISTPIESPLQQPCIFERREPAVHGWFRDTNTRRQFRKRRWMLRSCDGFEHHEGFKSAL